MLLAAAAAALLFANSSFAPVYWALLETPAGLRIGATEFSKPLLAWINEGLMTLFFFSVGLELKREAREGVLAKRSQLLLPAAAAAGGMAVPAAVYWAFNQGDPIALQGWAIPAATDIAFAAGVLALLGSRIPHALKVFVLTLAILDDLGAILIIALFYSGNLAFESLAIAAAAVGGLWAMNRRGVVALPPYFLVGIVLWAAVLNSGVHATLAGVVVAVFIPLKASAGHDIVAPLERGLHAPLAYAILPAFAFMNAGVPLAGMDAAALAQPVTLGIALGLLLGKCTGVLAGSWLAVRLGASLPQAVSWSQMTGAALVCGIGFTMSLFVASLAFEGASPALAIESRIGILAGSLASGFLGYAWLRFLAARQPRGIA